MKPFKRRPRLDLGRYEKTPDAPRPPVESVVSDGVLIALSDVRMAVKNRMILAVLRDGSDWDFDAHRLFAEERLAGLAATETASARRDRERIDSGPAGLAAIDPDERAWKNRREFERREKIHLALAERLLAAADEPAVVHKILYDARYAALDEIALHVTTRDAELRGAGRYADPEYETTKGERISALVHIDLAKLAEKHGTSPGQADLPYFCS